MEIIKLLFKHFYQGPLIVINLYVKKKKKRVRKLAIGHFSF